MEKDRPSFSGVSQYSELTFSMALGIAGPAVASQDSCWEECCVCVQGDASRGWCTFFLELLGTQRAHRGSDEGCWAIQAQFLGHRGFHGPYTFKTRGRLPADDLAGIVLCP